jgi:hypothetical protein
VVVRSAGVEDVLLSIHSLQVISPEELAVASATGVLSVGVAGEELEVVSATGVLLPPSAG